MTENLFAELSRHVVSALRVIAPDMPAEILSRIEVTPPRDPAHGDAMTNAAMVTAKPLGRAPGQIADELVARLVGQGGIIAAERAGPGFVNLRLDPAAFRAVLPTVLRAGLSYGDNRVGADLRVNLEYVSANPTGPMHIGHCRGAVVGDALANLLIKSGYAVTKEYYVNDAGAQVQALAWAAYWRYLQALGTVMTEEDFAARVPGGLQYRGEYLIAFGASLAERFGPTLADTDLTPADPVVWLDLVRAETVAGMMLDIRADLDRLGVRPGVFTSERALVEDGAADRTIARLHQDGLLYDGVLEPPKGKTPEDWEPREQTLFRSTQFGDDIDRPLRKSDGSNTYFANDIAYHADKIGRGADILIDVLGADHGGYVARMRAAVKAIGDGVVKFEAVLCQIVHVVRDGQPVRMSKRAGTYVTLRDLIDEVGRDAVRFTMLTRKPDAQMEFDLDAVVAQTRENPVFYVQYAHARCRSVLRAAAEMLGGAEVADHALAHAELGSLGAEVELAVMRRVALWPRVIEGAALAREPHRIAFYLHDLAADFHLLWTRGRDDASLRFLRPDHPTETRASLALVAAIAVTIRSGLAVLGVTPIEEMR